MLIEATFNSVTERILDAAIEVHRTLGPGLLESTYRECLEFELSARQMRFDIERVVPIVYKGTKLRTQYRVDLIVEDRIVVEVKSQAAILAIHPAQVITYLRLTGYPAGLLINFNVPRLMDGVNDCSTGAHLTFRLEFLDRKRPESVTTVPPCGITPFPR